MITTSLSAEDLVLTPNRDDLRGDHCQKVSHHPLLSPFACAVSSALLL